MWLRIKMKKTFCFVYPRILSYNFQNMKTNSYSVNVPQCIHAKQCFLLLKQKHTSCPEMTAIFYKGNYQHHRIIQKGLYDPTSYCSQLWTWTRCLQPKPSLDSNSLMYLFTGLGLPSKSTLPYTLQDCEMNFEILYWNKSDIMVLVQHFHGPDTACIRVYVVISDLERGTTVIWIPLLFTWLAHGLRFFVTDLTEGSNRGSLL